MATPLSIIVGLVSFLVLMFAVAFALAGGKGAYFCALAGACALSGVVLSLRGFTQHTVGPVVTVAASTFALLLNAAVLVGAVLLALALTSLAF
jgi:hypothetical protein